MDQKIESVSQQDEPLSAGIIFDSSSSMRDKISRARDAAAAFLKFGNSEDEYFLVEFGSAPTLSQSFTTDITRFQNRFVSIGVRGKTALFDAVYLGLEKLKGHGRRRKALLLITDGEDNHSRYTSERRAGTQRAREERLLCVNGLSCEQIQGRPPEIRDCA